MDQTTGITLEFQDALASYCIANPDFFGLYLTGCNLSLFPMAQIRTILGSWRRNLMALRNRPLNPALLKDIPILIDASVGGHHMSVWLPTAAGLIKRGHRVGLVGASPEPSPAVLQTLGKAGTGAWDYFHLSEASTAAGPTPIFFDFRTPRAPFRGLMHWALESMKTNLIRLERCWEGLLKNSAVEAVVSTSPLGFWSSALMRASQKLGRQNIYLNISLPDATFYRNYQADAAVVWSRMGKEALLHSGWNQCRFLMAKNPSLLTKVKQESERHKRRQQLGVQEGELLVLVLGQKAFDVAFRVDGYPETCRLIGDGLMTASRTSSLRVLFRPHHGESRPETEMILRACGLDNLLVSTDAALLEDIAAADMAISQQSTALEEAYLSGCPILQVVKEGVALEADFRWLGAPLARDRKTLENLVLDLSWKQQLLPLEDDCPVEEAIEELLARRNAATGTTTGPQAECRA